MLSHTLLPIAGAILYYVLYYVYRASSYRLRNVPGPRSPSFIFGNFKQIQDDNQLTKRWREEFGPIFRFKHLYGIRHLHVSDVKALGHILANGSAYQRPTSMNESRKNLLGNGILNAEDDDHRRQAKLQNQAFGTAQIGRVTEIFVQKSVQLRDIWASQLAQENSVSARVDVFSWLRRMTLDVIGQAGFGYNFDSLETTEKPNELNHALTELMHTSEAKGYQLFEFTEAIFPPLKRLPYPGKKVIYHARREMRSVAGRIVSDSIRISHGEKSFDSKKDLLSVLLRANLAKDVPERQRMRDDEVISQIPAFLVAGHETSSSAVAWALHALSLDAPVQTKLREELFTISTDNPTMEELNSLTYLESVVREVLRVYSPVPFLERMAMQDDVLPLSKPYIDKAGKSHDSLLIPKGQIIHVPIMTVNTEKEIWGDDAEEFKPQRWENVPAKSSAIPSVWGNQLTFFAGRNHCIGFRFSLVETKALLFTLVRAFEFEPAVYKGGIGITGTGLQAPMILAESEKGTSLPLLLKLYNP
ncbi:cytochrome P450 [Mycena galopus ATCC 62051]|nr:cytochrome P450 [Mycena galopus ATCC 62051]